MWKKDFGKQPRKKQIDKTHRSVDILRVSISLGKPVILNTDGALGAFESLRALGALELL